MQSHNDEESLKSSQEAFVERMKMLRRADPDSLLPSDLPLNIPQTPEEELAQLIRKSEELTEIFRVCKDVGYYGETSLVEFIRERLK